MRSLTLCSTVRGVEKSNIAQPDERGTSENTSARSEKRKRAKERESRGNEQQQQQQQQRNFEKKHAGEHIFLPLACPYVYIGGEGKLFRGEKMLIMKYSLSSGRYSAVSTISANFLPRVERARARAFTCVFFFIGAYLAPRPPQPRGAPSRVTFN